MTPQLEVDLTTGRLRLGGHHLDALLHGLHSPFAAPAPPGDSDELDRAWSELMDAGVVNAAGEPAAAFAESFAVLVTPWLVVQALAVGVGGQVAHQLWVGPTTGLAAAHVRDGWYDLIPLSSAATAAAVIRLCSLGPRPHPESGESTVQPDVVNAIATGAVAERDRALGSLADALAGWPDVAAAVLTGDWRLVQVSTDWAPGLFADEWDAAAAAQALLLLDTPSGLLILDPSGEAVAIHSTSPTDVWQVVVALLRPPAAIDPASPLVRLS